MIVKTLAQLTKNIFRKQTTLTVKSNIVKRDNRIKQFKFNSKISSNPICTFTQFSNKNPFLYKGQPNNKISHQSEIKPQKKQELQQLPILKLITEARTQQDLIQIYKAIRFLKESHIEIAIRYIMTAIYKGNLPLQTLDDEKFKVIIKPYPNITLESEIYRISKLLNRVRALKITQQQQQTNQMSQQMRDQNQVKELQLYNRINDLFYEAFNTSLKKISPSELNRSKATLYKHFAQYNFEYLFNPNQNSTDVEKQNENIGFLNKSRQLLTQSLKCHKQLILQQYQKIDSQQMKKLKVKHQQRHRITINAIKQNIRKIVESMGQCLYAYFKVINKEFKYAKNSEQFRKRKIELLSYLQTYLPLYSIIPGIKAISMSYFKLTKIKIEASFTSSETPKSPEDTQRKLKKVIEQYAMLFKECQDSIQEVQEIQRFQNLKQLASTMIAVKFMMGRTLRKSQTDIRSNLAQGAKDIIDHVKKQWKKPIQQYLTKIIKQMLKVRA